MKEFVASDESMAEFSKDVAMLDEFRCDHFVHLYGACSIPNHIMLWRRLCRVGRWLTAS